MHISHATILFLAAVLAGAINAVAGGGSFISFPTLLFVGIPPVNANATNTVALWPGQVASIGAYRNQFRHLSWPTVMPLLVTGRGRRHPWRLDTAQNARKRLSCGWCRG